MTVTTPRAWMSLGAVTSRGGTMSNAQVRRVACAAGMSASSV